jgi:hypothetical protein
MWAASAAFKASVVFAFRAALSTAIDAIGPKYTVSAVRAALSVRSSNRVDGDPADGDPSGRDPVRRDSGSFERGCAASERRPKTCRKSKRAASPGMCWANSWQSASKLEWRPAALPTRVFAMGPTLRLSCDSNRSSSMRSKAGRGVCCWLFSSAFRTSTIV